jgi:phage terminase large subunit-like protein
MVGNTLQRVLAVLSQDEGRTYWWQPWENEHIPKLQHVIQSYDTAFSAKETADYSAITTWGVFFPKEDGKPAMILLDALKGKFDFPELKAVAMDQFKYWEPESVIIEAKATGEPLMQEFRRMGIPVIPFVPSRGKRRLCRQHYTSRVKIPSG